jgi:hypothetical protein
MKRNEDFVEAEKEKVLADWEIKKVTVGENETFGAGKILADDVDEVGKAQIKERFVAFEWRD